MGQVQLRPYDPAHLCPKCGSEGAKPHHHQAPILAVFGSSLSWPCSDQDMQKRAGEHMCNRCEVCSFAWMEALPGMTGHSPE